MMVACILQLYTKNKYEQVSEEGIKILKTTPERVVVCSPIFQQRNRCDKCMVTFYFISAFIPPTTATAVVVVQTKRVAMQCILHPNKYVRVYVVLAYGVNRLPLPPLVSLPPPRPPPPPPLAADDTPYCGYEL